MAEIDRLDVLLVPGAGNRGTVAAMQNPVLLDWIRRIDRHTTWTTSVCTGALILGRPACSETAGPRTGPRPATWRARSA
ncbi:hypothetical protein ACFVYA_45670 [Amycolatopsis sp. NPDC058278]|uniref:hypothetical protein n=1 Tax=Amycolatopsis sp. NPDC058278 TaxID=3346417 RepID=UPI0036DDA4CB